MADSGETKGVTPNGTNGGLDHQATDGTKRDLGVLLVHGIGETRRGDTLACWGAALFRVLDHLMHGANGRAEFLDTQLQANPDADRDPPHAELRILHLLDQATDDQKTQHQPAQDQTTEDQPTQYQTTPDQTAEAKYDVRPPRRSDFETHWLLAESWWGREFPQPAYFELLIWSFKVVPWTLLAHFDRKLRRAQFRSQAAGTTRDLLFEAFRWMVGASSLMLGLLLVMPLLVVLWIALLLGMLPGPFKSAAAWIQRIIAQYLGDAYILVGNKVAHAAICGRVRRDLDWLAERCERVAIVAHSQGGAIAHDVLRADPLAPCDYLITFGSGLRKLSEIRRADETGGQSYVVVATWGAILITAALLGGVLAPDDLVDPLGLFVRTAILFSVLGFCTFAASCVRNPTGKIFAIGAIGIFTFLAVFFISTRFGQVTILEGGLLLVVCVGISITWAGRARWLKKTGRSTVREMQGKLDEELFERYFRLPGKLPWIDFFASSDPVPNGLLLDDLYAGGMHSYEVANRGSVLEDHTTYWQNADQFVWRTLLTLLDASGVDGERLFAQRFESQQQNSTTHDAQHRSRNAVMAAHARRQWRVLWIKWLRRLAFIAFVTIAWKWWTAAPAWVDFAVDNVRLGITKIPWVGEPLAGSQHPGLASLPGLVALGLTVVIVYSIGRAIWLLWDNAESKRLIRGDSVRWWEPWGLVLSAYWLAGCTLLFLPPQFTPVGTLIAIAWAVVILAGILYWEITTWIGGLVNPWRGLWMFVAAEDPATLLKRRDDFEEAWRLRQAKAGNGEAYRRLGRIRENYARSLRPDDAARGQAIAEAVTFYRAGQEFGNVGAAWSLGLLRQEQAKEYAKRGKPDLSERMLNEAKESFHRGANQNDRDCLYALGCIERELQNDDEALRAFKTAAELGDAIALNEVATHLLKSGKSQQAEEMFQQSAEHGYSWSYYELGRLAQVKGETLKAIQWYGKALNEGKDFAALKMGEMHVMEGRFNLAFQVYEQAAARGSSEAELALGRLWESSLAPDAARDARLSYDRAYRLARRHDEDSTAAEALRALARLDWLRGDNTAARQLIRDAINDMPSARMFEAIAHFWEYDARQPSEAKIPLRKAVEWARRDKDTFTYRRAVTNLAHLLVDEGNSCEAMRVLRESLDAFASPRIALALGGLQIDTADRQGAEESFRQALALSKTREPQQDQGAAAEAAIRLAALLREANRGAEGDEILHETLGRLDDPQAILQVANDWIRANDWKSGRAAAEKALKIAQSQRDATATGDAAVVIAHGLLDHGEAAEARRLLEETAAEHYAAEAALELAKLWETDEKTEQAIAAYEQAKRLARQNDARWTAEQAVSALGRLHQERGDSGAAIKVLTDSLHCENSAMAAQELADLYRELDQIDSAEQFYRQAYDMRLIEGSDWTDVAQALANMLSAEERTREAKQVLEESLQEARNRHDDDKIESATFKLVDFLRSIEKPAAARALLEETAISLNSASVALRLGWDYAESSENENAALWFRRSIERARHDQGYIGVSASRELARILAEQGDAAAAQSVLEEAVHVFGTSSAIQELAAWHAEAGNIAESRELFERAFAQAIKAQELWNCGHILRDYAEAMQKAGRLGEVREFFQSALVEVDFKVDDASALLSIGACFLSAGETEVGRQAIARAAELGDSAAQARLAELDSGAGT